MRNTKKEKFIIRKMRMADIKDVHRIINSFASKGEMLSRPLKMLYEGVRDFFVAQKGKEVLGCASLHILWEDLAEIRGVAVKEGHQSQGIGRALIRACLGEAKSLGIANVFLLTNKPDYFAKFNFHIVPKKKMPQKIWGECINCPKFPEYCDEIAMISGAKQNEKRS